MLKEIEERKKVEAALRESEEKFRKIFENSAVAIMFADADERLVSWNKFTEDLLGMTPDDLNGKTLQSLYPAKEWEKIRALNVRKVGMAEHCETAILLKNGELLDVDISLSVLKDAAGNVTGSIGIARDISERKQSESRIQKKVNETVEKLMQAEYHLIQTEKMNALGELTASIAHELNQPLNVTKIISQSILRDIEKGRFSAEDAQKDLPEIVKQMNKMAEIIVHMRNFARGMANAREVQDLRTVVGNALVLMRQQFSNHQIELLESHSPEAPQVKIDPIQIEQVCMNLLNNARYAVEKAPKKEGMRVTIKTYFAPDKKHVVLEVSDNGQGIPEAAKPMIFQSFFTTKEPGKGTGLGLSVCRKIVEDHQGRVEFDSREGEGATFRVFLPMFGNGTLDAA